MKSLKRQDLEDVLAQVVRQGGLQRRVLTTQVFSQADAKGLMPPLASTLGRMRASLTRLAPLSCPALWALHTLGSTSASGRCGHAQAMRLSTAEVGSK